MKNFFEKHKIKLGVICATLIISIGGFFALPNEYKVYPIAESFELELGSQINNDVTTYIDGIESAVNEAQLDISQVDTFTAGDYQIYINIGKRSIPYDVKIVDSVAPSLSVNQELKYLAIEREYDVNLFVSEVSDLSNTSEVYFKVGDNLQNTISFATVGEHTLTVIAKDISGNTTEQSTTINTEVPPRFMGLADATIPVGADYDYTEAFMVYDETDGFITDSVTITADNVDLSLAGTYKIIYSVVNSRGIDNSKTIYITTSPDASTAYEYTTNLTREDWEILANNNYFKYELLDESNTDADKAAELVKPISINVSRIYSETTKSAGAAFIYKIEEDYIYALSVQHVIAPMSEDCYLTFHDDSSTHTSVEYVDLGSNSELALFRFETRLIPKETLLTLKEPYIDTTYYNTMEVGTPLLAYVENYSFYPDFRRVLMASTLVNVNEPNHPDMGYKYPALATTRSAFSGMSGSPLIDYQGRVLGSTSYLSLSRGKDYFMKLDTLEELIQKFEEKYGE